MRLRDYIIRRLILAVPVIFGVLLISFMLAYVVGDPVSLWISERTRPEAIAAIRHAHGLDQPLPVQFLYYIRSLLMGDWGYSPTARMPVTEALATFFPATAELAVWAMVFAVLVGIPLGILSATKKDKPTDHVTRIIALAGVSMPIFRFALMLKSVLFFQLSQMGLPHLPSSDRYTYYIPYTPITNFVLIDSIITGNAALFFDGLAHLAMPAICLAYLTLAVIARMMRSSMLEVLKEDYITLARSKGLRERVVVYRHALRNAMIPTVTVIGLGFGGLLSGAVLTETIFSWPGIGRWSTASIFSSDIPSISAFVLVVALVYVAANMIVDLVYGALDPRIRYG
jgi:peptide/nickel transport system permease protein